MPCRQADCLRGYRKWGGWREGHGEGEGLRLQGTTLRPPNTKFLRKQVSSLPPPAAHNVTLLKGFRLICPSAPLPRLYPKPLSLLAPNLVPHPTTFYKGFIMSKTANFSLVCERGNVLSSPQHLLFSQPMNSPPPSFALLWEMKEG